MAGFSSFEQQQPFLLDSLLLPINSTTSHELSSAANSLDLMMSYVTNKNCATSMDHSSSTVTHMEKKRKCKHPSSANTSAQSKDKREVKGKKQRKMIKEGEELKKKSKKEKKAAEAQLASAGYIHVRARRGQATDSHSLAERVRRERISERMKLLQALVPGCDKVTGKALMLDEVINYVQSLQNQVEFLSMKFASVNPMFYDFGKDLESFMVTPHQDLSSLPSPMQECSPTISPNNYNLLQENSVKNSILFPNVLPQASSGQTLWEVDDHRPKIFNKSAFSNSFFSFH